MHQTTTLTAPISAAPWRACANPDDRGWDTPNIQDATGKPILNVEDYQSPEGQANWLVATASPLLYNALMVLAKDELLAALIAKADPQAHAQMVEALKAADGVA